MREPEQVTTADALERVAARLLQTDAVAVDTEFFWERTFYPVLGLVQLATGDDACWLVDTVSIGDIRALGPVLASATVTKVLHDAPQDLGILARATGVLPRQIFDTRVAAGFTDIDPTCSLQALLRQVLHVELTKTETRSDWLRRPLSAKQVRYAADDVLHLLPLREKLLAGCASDTVRAWLREDLARLDDSAGYLDRDPRRMYLRVKGGSHLKARPLAVLREVAAWREREARQRDWPRGHVLPDDVLIALARLAPVDLQALAAVPDLPRNMPEAVRVSLLGAVTQGMSVPDAECPQPADSGFALRRTLKPQGDRLLAHIGAVCARHHVHPATVASRAEIDAFVRLIEQGAAASHPLMHGWRKTFLGTPFDSDLCQ